MPEDRDAVLDALLEEAREAGFLGPGDVRAHVLHARHLAAVVRDAPARFLDLGSGGGVPGLVLALAWPDARAVFLDASERRTRFVEDACRRLGIDGRAEGRLGRAEELARDPALRGSFDLVVARAFGAPAVTAECAVGFLRRGGRLVVSEPPDERPSRWPEAGLATLGLGPVVLSRKDGTGVAVMELLGDVEDRWPRRTGIPAKRPLWKDA